MCARRPASASSVTFIIFCVEYEGDKMPVSSFHHGEFLPIFLVIIHLPKFMHLTLQSIKSSLPSVCCSDCAYRDKTSNIETTDKLSWCKGGT